MSELDHLCPGCFVSGGARPCTKCGYEGEEDRPWICLPSLAVLQENFIVGRLLGKPGSFGITYLGWDRLLKRKVAIKEYLPRQLAGRVANGPKVRSHSVEEAGAFSYGLEKFIEEARILADLDHPHIVRVQRFFEENGTAYLVMDYHDGLSLDQYLEGGKQVSQSEAVVLLLPILEALSHIHAKELVHRDVKPSNIYLKGGRIPILLDFGAARTALGERTRNLSVLLSPGYAPVEQYSSHGQLGPWTDIYAVAATLYRMLTGKGPLDANSRSDLDTLEPPDRHVPGLSPQLCQVVLTGLAIRRQDRPQSAEAFSRLLRDALAATGPASPTVAVSTALPKMEPSTTPPKTEPSTAPPKAEPSTVEPQAAPSTAPPKAAPSTAPPKTASATAPPKAAPSTVAPKPTSTTPKPAPSPGLKPTASTVAPKAATSSALPKPAAWPIHKGAPSPVAPRLTPVRQDRHEIDRSRSAPRAALTPHTKLAERPFVKPWFRQYLALSGFLVMLSGVVPLLFSRNDWIYDPTAILVPVRGLEAGEVLRNERDGLEYAWIPPGEFQMGCTLEVDGPCSLDEIPHHRVTVGSFWLSVTEVTVEAFGRFEKSAGRPAGTELTTTPPDHRGPKHPIVYVDWFEADRFCRWSGGRLPTEAEWEYAARRGTSRRYPWGNEAPMPRKGARNGAAFSGTGSAEVGSFGSNEFHLFDMAGNVWEWCEDKQHNSYEGAPSDGSAWLSQGAIRRLTRGGSWKLGEKYLRLANRSFNDPGKPAADLGFRCARDTPPLSAPKSSAQQPKP